MDKEIGKRQSSRVGTVSFCCCPLERGRGNVQYGVRMVGRMRATQVFMDDYYFWEIIGTKNLKTNYKYV